MNLTKLRAIINGNKAFISQITAEIDASDAEIDLEANKAVTCISRITTKIDASDAELDLEVNKAVISRITAKIDASDGEIELQNVLQTLLEKQTMIERLHNQVKF